MTCFRQQPVVRRARCGFTLLEVLIALALTVVLLSAVYAAIDLYWKFESTGRGQMQRLQLLRAVVQRMNEDIGSVAFIPSDEADEDDEDDESAGADASSGQMAEDMTIFLGGADPSMSDSTSTTSGAGPVVFGIVGTSEEIQLTVSKPSRGLSYAMEVSPECRCERTSDLMTVTYGLAPVPMEAFFTSSNQQDSSQTQHTNVLLSGRPMTGLGRRAADLSLSSVTLAGGTADAPITPLATSSSLSPELMQNTLPTVGVSLEDDDLLAAEIVELQFRYFDGVTWLPSWDSRTIGALPLAVEVSLGFWNEPPRRRRRAGVNNAQRGTVSTIQHVFHVPISVPLVGSELGQL